MAIALANNFLKFSLGRGGPMDIKTKYGWQELYATALLETDWTKIEQKIQAAEGEIGARLHEFSLNHGGTPEENQAIVDALHGLDVLRKEVVGWHRSQRAG
jgi:hypothetical protein